MIIIKTLVKVVRKVIFAFLVLYGLNVILSSVSFNIPINLVTLSIGTILGIPGILVLIILKLMI